MIPFQAPSPEELAALLPQYAINGFIAQGGMGAVYLGRQIALDREVAIKILPREVGADPEFRESFAAEAKAMARLNHPNLIGVFDFGDVDGMPYIVMEYVEGSSLHASAWNTAVEPVQAVTIVKGICDGLAHAHGHGIVHRDIKPANILLNLKAEPKIGDFGLAHPADADTPGLVMGTPGYTAPEVFHDPKQAGTLADIYAVGVILHQLLSGIDPAGSMTPPTVPIGRPRLDAIWRKATHINPAMRFASVEEMIQALEAWLRNPTAMAVGQAPAGFSALQRPVAQRPVVVSHGGGGMGLVAKLFIIALLTVVVVFLYQLLQENKEKINNGLVGAPGQAAQHPAAPAIDPVVMPGVNEGKKTSSAPRIMPLPVLEDRSDDTAAFRDEQSDARDETTAAAESPADDSPDLTEISEPGDPELRQRAVGLIEEARAKREKDYEENARTLVFQLGAYSKRFSRPEQIERIRKMQELVVNHRAPVIDGADDLSADLIKLFDYAHTKEKEIEQTYLASLMRIRDAYVSRLNGAAGEASDDGLKRRLLAQADEAKSLEGWVALLSPEPEMSRSRLAGGSGKSFAGRWDVQTDNHTQWLCDENGLVTINDGKWKGRTGNWKILEDGTLEVHWPDKVRPYVFTRDGKGWSGKTSFGKPATATPGNW